MWSRLLKCINCKNVLEKTNVGFFCNGCQREYPSLDGIYCFSDEANDLTDFFPEDSFSRLYEAENTNFWFRVRNIIIGNALRRYLPIKSEIMEVGCGTGFVASHLQKIGYTIDCADLFLQGLRYCKKRRAGTNYYQFNVYDELFYDHYDGICAFDVIEHIDNDKLALKNIHSALKKGGFLFITVPANKKLWSKNDEYAKHKRRYNIVDLKEIIREGGFEIIRISYFMTFLYPFIYISRRLLLNRSTNDDIEEQISNELQINPLLNSIFFNIFRLESYLLNYVNLPFGSSLLCIAQKRDD